MRLGSLLLAGLLAAAFPLTACAAEGDSAAPATSTQVPAPTASTPANPYPMLPPGKGRDAMIAVCSQCHSPAIAARQRLTAKGWTDLVNMMASNGADATDAQFDEITAYLIKAFPPSADDAPNP